jgi:hypothetical protein
MDGWFVFNFYSRIFLAFVWQHIVSVKNIQMDGELFWLLFQEVQCLIRMLILHKCLSCPLASSRSVKWYDSGSRRTESTQDHCSLCFPEEVFMTPAYHIPCLRLGPGQPESCNKLLEKFSPVCRVFKIGSHLNILNIVFPRDFPFSTAILHLRMLWIARLAILACWDILMSF